MTNDFISSDLDTRIFFRHWTVEEPKAVLVIFHGMLEHIGRYQPFAEWLQQHHIAVMGHDHRGHGHSLSQTAPCGHFADKDGNRYLIDDAYHMIGLARQAYPTLPLFVMGHSMGSFLLRQLLHTYQLSQIQGAILMGTGFQPKGLIQLGYGLSRLIAHFKGPQYKSRLLYQLALGNNSRQFKHRQSDYDWLSPSSQAVNQYRNDPYIFDNFTAQAYADMFKGMLTNYDRKRLLALDKQIPLLLISGAEDPIGNQGHGVQALYENYCQLGYQDVSLSLLPKARHELLNDHNLAAASETIVQWMEAHYPA